MVQTRDRIREALQQKDGLAHHWVMERFDNVVELNDRCPQCGQWVVCAYQLSGLADYYHSFFHTCLNAACAWSEEGEVKEGNLGGGGANGAVANCPLCSRSSLQDNAL